MGYDFNKKPILERKVVSTKPQRFIVYVEGRNTEKSYLEKFKRTNVSLRVIKGHGISSCEQFLEDCEKHYDRLSASERKKYSQRWLMFDYDGRPDFGKAIKMARDKGFRVAFSSMCLEYWFLLHFEAHNGSSIPMIGESHSKAQIMCINKHIREYNKRALVKVAKYDDSSKEVSDDFFDLMMAINPSTGNPRIADAILRSKAIHINKKHCGKEFQESVSSVYELLKELGIFEEIDAETIKLK